MITPFHIGFSLAIYLILIKLNLVSFTIPLLILLLLAELIDIDHLFSKPIYVKKRNPFKTHFLHKNWKLILVVGIALLFIKPVLTLGVGLLNHIFLDYIYIKGNKI